MSRPFFGGTLEGCGQLGQAIWGMILYYYHTYILANLIAVYLSVFYGIKRIRKWFNTLKN